MSYAVCVKSFEHASLENAVSVIEEVISQAGLRRYNDYISRVWIFCTPHFAELMPEIAQAAVAKSNCLNVWGGCVSGLLQGTQVTGHEPGVLVSLFGKEFEPSDDDSGAKTEVSFCIAENDNDTVRKWSQVEHEPIASKVAANTIGLLSYGANYVKMPSIEHGRISHANEISNTLATKKPLVLNSEGLSFLTDPLLVSESNGLFLIKVNGLKAAEALDCPQEQTRPVGLRLHVIHEQGESWIPVMEIHADGVLGLAAPVMKGQRVRLAKRTPKAIEQDIAEWLPAIQENFGGQPPQLGILFAGFERSQMCHAFDDDIAAVVRAFPDTTWIGLFGQAAWLAQDHDLITPPRNNRISLCMFNPNHV